MVLAWIRWAQTGFNEQITKEGFHKARSYCFKYLRVFPCTGKADDVYDHLLEDVDQSNEEITLHRRQPQLWAT